MELNERKDCHTLMYKKLKGDFEENHITEIVGNNDKKTKGEIRDKIIENCKEGYGKKNLQTKRLKYIQQEGTIPKMRGLPKDIEIKPIVNGKSSVLEKLEEKWPKFSRY